MSSRQKKMTFSPAYRASQQNFTLHIMVYSFWNTKTFGKEESYSEKSFCLLLPDLDFSSPVTCCKEWWQDWVKFCTHTSFFMGRQSANNPSSMIVVEKHFAMRTSCHQKRSIWRKFTAHCKSFHLMSFISFLFVDSVRSLGRKQCHVVPVCLSNKHRLSWVQSQTGASVTLMKNLIGDFGSTFEVPCNNGTISWVPAYCIRACEKFFSFSEKEYIQRLLYCSFVNSCHLVDKKVSHFCTENDKLLIPRT